MATTDKTATAPHLLVVIDHQEARVYRTEVHGAVPERSSTTDPHGHGRGRNEDCRSGGKARSFGGSLYASSPAWKTCLTALTG